MNFRGLSFRKSSYYKHSRVVKFGGEKFRALSQTHLTGRLGEMMQR